MEERSDMREEPSSPRTNGRHALLDQLCETEALMSLGLRASQYGTPNQLEVLGTLNTRDDQTQPVP
jgi:hypothetical protein